MKGGKAMKSKKVLALGLAASFIVIPAAAVVIGKGHQPVFYDVFAGKFIAREDLWQYLRSLQESVYYGGNTTGTATLISWDDYLLDGDYENGELINGGIYYSMEDAFRGYQKDRMDALMAKFGIERAEAE